MAKVLVFSPRKLSTLPWNLEVFIKSSQPAYQVPEKFFFVKYYKYIIYRKRAV
jgi:hypothetical protein